MIKQILTITFAFVFLSKSEAQKSKPHILQPGEAIEIPFKVEADRFADIQVLRYQVPGFETLTPQQKELAYYLYEAALCGRDIIWDQKYKNNLIVRRTLEGIWLNYSEDKNSKDYQKRTTQSNQNWSYESLANHWSLDQFFRNNNDE
jgi:dipeptidyl-peptidase-3